MYKTLYVLFFAMVLISLLILIFRVDARTNEIEKQIDQSVATIIEKEGRRVEIIKTLHGVVISTGQSEEVINLVTDSLVVAESGNVDYAYMKLQTVMSDFPELGSIVEYSTALRELIVTTIEIEGYKKFYNQLVKEYSFLKDGNKNSRYYENMD